MKGIVLLLLLGVSPALIAGQSSRRPATKPAVKPTPKPTSSTPAIANIPSTEPTPSTVAPPGKKNGRPATDPVTVKPLDQKFVPVYVYTFDRPGFVYSNVKIEHDETGRGRIWFKRDGYEEPIDDPLTLSPATVEALTTAFRQLNFLDSTEEYQYAARDFSKIGRAHV